MTTYEVTAVGTDSFRIAQKENGTITNITEYAKQDVLFAIKNNEQKVTFTEVAKEQPFLTINFTFLALPSFSDYNDLYTKLAAICY